MLAANIFLWGTRIGVIAQDDINTVPFFSYDKAFINSGIEVSPVVMPLSDRIYSFPSLSKESFKGLPGMLADSLPDKFGNKIIDRYLTETGRDLNSISPIERMLFIGSRGMGALEFTPAMNFITEKNEEIEINELVKVASDILTNREETLIKNHKPSLEQLIQVGTSAGGARAKVIIAWNKVSGIIRSGQIQAGDGFEYYIMKLDGVSNNKDKENKPDSKMHTRIEYAYYLMATDSGIKMNPCELYQENDRYHFLTKRFDRADNGQKIHMQTLGGLAHYDFNIPHSNSYEQVAQLILKLGLGQDTVEQFYRRMVFNVCAQNNDDHVKNISFLMDKTGKWQLSPAYDITFAKNKDNQWLKDHQMTINGKAGNFTMDDLLDSAVNMNLTKRTAKKIVKDVQNSINKWNKFAVQADLSKDIATKVKKEFTSFSLGR